MNRIITTLLAFILVQSCNSQIRNKSIDRYLDPSIKVDSLNIPTDFKQAYFPLGLFTDTSISKRYDSFQVEWYSSHLHAMREPILFNKNPNKEIYRFLWLRSFHNPVAIRIEKQNNDYTLIWKLCDGAGGYEPGNLIINQTKKIDKESWDKFYSLLNTTDFWNLNTNEGEVLGTDGSQWILEGVDNENYHVVDRWTPSSGDYYDCCDFLIGLTDLKIEKDDKY